MIDQLPSVIDIHTHLLCAGVEPSDEELTEAETLARRWNVRRMVLLGNITARGGYEPGPQDVGAINTHTLGVMSRCPDLYVGFCYLSPAHDPGFIRAEMDRCLVEGGMRGIKLWVAVKATDQRLDPIMVRAAELGVPVLHHAWYKVTGNLANESTPAEVADLARRFPQVTIVMAHLGGGRERGVLDIADLPNLYVDTAGSQPESELLEYAVRRLGPRRVVFGSDWPLRDLGIQIGRVLGARLDRHDKELILYGNAARLLGLESESP